MRIFSDGVFAHPSLQKDGQWRWVIDEFVADSTEWLDGKQIILFEESDTKDGLIVSSERINELQEMRDEFILNESIFADENPSWGEVIDANAIAEQKWDKTENGKELKKLLGIEE